MIYANNLGHKFWGEVIITATYLKNRSPTRSTTYNKTPYEVWTGRKPSLKHLQIFGSTAYSFIPKEKRTKMDSKTQKVIFVGYSEDSKAYQLYDPVSKKIIRSRDVHFRSEHAPIPEPLEEVGDMFTIPLRGDAPKDLPEEDLHTEDLGEIYDGVQEEEREISPLPVLRRGTRMQQPPRKYWIKDSSIDAEANIAYLEEPQSYQEAMSQDNATECVDAMKMELDSITNAKTWTLTTLPPGR